MNLYDRLSLVPRNLVGVVAKTGGKINSNTNNGLRKLIQLLVWWLKGMHLNFEHQQRLKYWHSRKYGCAIDECIQQNKIKCGHEFV